MSITYRFSPIALRLITEFARDLLELVVDGPEMDDIFNACSWDDNESQKTSGSLTQEEDAMMDDV